MKIRTFSEIKNIYGNRSTIIEKNYGNRIMLAEEGIALNFSLAGLVEEKNFEEYKKTEQKLEGFPAFKSILFRKSIHFLNASLLLFRNGHVDAAYSCLRSVLENIWKLYFLELVTEDEGKLLYKHEMKQLIGDEALMVKCKYKYFSPGYMRNFLYSHRKKQFMNEAYGVLSEKTHPSIVGALGDLEFQEAPLLDLARLLPIMSVALLIVGLEISNESIEENSALQTYFDTVGADIGSIPDLLPNKDNSTSKLRIKLTGTTIDPFEQKSTDDIADQYGV